MNEGVKRDVWGGRECMYVPAGIQRRHVRANPTLGPALAREVECGCVLMYNMYNAILRMRQS